jgi:hypothetical protein
MPALDRIVMTTKCTHYFLGGREVTKKEYERVYPPPKLGASAEMPGQWTRPTLSDSMGVHSSQIDEAEARNKRHGIAITYVREGENIGAAIVPSRAEQRKLMKVMGLRDNNAFY